MNKSAAWIGLVMSSAVTKTFVHFYPSAGPVVAPYEVVSTFTLFGEGVETQTIGIEGARLAQPDGVPVQELFSCLREPKAGLLGIKVELSSTSSRGRLDASQCIIELKSRESSVKYRAKRLLLDDSEQNVKYQNKLFLNLNDKFNTSSLIAVNASAYSVTTTFADSGRSNAQSSDSEHEEHLQRHEGLAPFAVQEFNFKEGKDLHDSRWGGVATEVVELQEPHSEFAYFSMYKDVATNRAVSVSPL